LAIGGLFLIIHRQRQLVHVIAPIMIIALLIPASVSAAVLSPSSLDSRTTGWAEVVDQIASNPLGSGVGSVGAAAQKADDDDNIDRFPTAVSDDAYQPDNYYMKVLIELGPFGLWLFLAAILGCWFHGRRLSRTRDGVDGALAAGITAATVAPAAAGLVSSYWEIRVLSLVASRTTVPRPAGNRPQTTDGESTAQIIAPAMVRMTHKRYMSPSELLVDVTVAD
jgi:O-antigen ligase